MVIDLGYDREAPEVTAVLPGRVGRWWRGLGPRVRRHMSYAVALVVLAGAALAGASRSVPPFEPVFDVALGPRGGYVLDDERLYALTVGPDGSTTFGAYRLADGAPLWTVSGLRADQPDMNFNIVTRPGLVALVAARDDSMLAETTGYDPATGRRRWQRSGRIIGGTPDGRVLILTALPQPCDLPRCDAVELTPDTPHELSAADPGSGVASWQARLSARENMSTTFDWRGGVVRRAALVDAAGRLAVRDLVTGSVRTGAALPGEPSEYAVVLFGDLVLVRSPRQDLSVEITGYDLATLRPRWSTTMRDFDGGVWPCGAVLCASGPTGTVALDPANGGTLWRLPNRMIGDELAGGLLIAYRSNAPMDERGTTWVVDAQTGLVRYTLVEWMPLGESPRSRDPLVIRWRAPAGRALFGTLHAETGQVLPIGALSGLWQRCAAAPATAPTRLACQTVGNRVQVWRFAAPSA